MIVEFFGRKVLLSGSNKLEVRKSYALGFVGVILYFDGGSYPSMTILIIFQLSTSTKDQRVPSQFCFVGSRSSIQPAELIGSSGIIETSPENTSCSLLIPRALPGGLGDFFYHRANS